MDNLPPEMPAIIAVYQQHILSAVARSADPETLHKHILCMVAGGIDAKHGTATAVTMLRTTADDFALSALYGRRA